MDFLFFLPSLFVWFFRETKKAQNESQVVSSIKLNFFFEKHLHQRNQSKTLCIFKIFFFISVRFLFLFYSFISFSLTIEMISFEWNPKNWFECELNQIDTPLYSIIHYSVLKEHVSVCDVLNSTISKAYLFIWINIQHFSTSTSSRSKSVFSFQFIYFV